MFPLIVVITLAFYVSTAYTARASFSVHFPWATRAPPENIRFGLRDYNPFCGNIIHNPQRFAGWTPTFVSFSGNEGDLVSVRYARIRVPRSRDDFPHVVASSVPIPASGQLCFDVQMPTPAKEPEYGTLLFEAEDPSTGHVSFHCSDVKLVNEEVLAEGHPAMCAKNNETLIPMPDEFL